MQRSRNSARGSKGREGAGPASPPCSACSCSSSCGGKKKTLSASEQNPQERACYRQVIEQLRPYGSRLIFIDESSINTDLIRRYGRAPKKERVYGSVPRNTPPAHSIIGALSSEGLIASMAVQGAIDGEAFAAFVQTLLVPHLQPDDIVLLDNNSTHANAQALESIQAAGAWPVFLPTYSPDLNPIEHCWAKVKGILRDVGARTARTLRNAFQEAANLITPQDAQGWFNHCGYWASLG